MLGEKNKTRKKTPKWFVVVLTTFFIVILLGSIVAVGYQLLSRGKIYLGVRAAGQNLGGLTQKQAYDVLDRQKESIIDNGIDFVYQEQKINIPPALVATDPNLALPIFQFDIEQTAKTAYDIGRTEYWLYNALSQMQLLLVGRQLDMALFLNEEELLNILKLNFDEAQKPAKNARLVFDSGFETVTVEEAQEGWEFDYGAAIKEVKKNLKELKNEPITLATIDKLPEIKRSETAKALLSARQVLATSTPKFSFEQRSWQLTQKQVTDWLIFSRTEDDDVILSFDPNRLSEYLEGTIAPAIDIEPVEALFNIEDGRVNEFRHSGEGRKLNLEETVAEINRQYFENNNVDIQLVVSIDKPRVATEDLNNLGIVELLGRGHSNFAGSPANRRHNIGVGTASLNGILIAPDEEFSMLEALGEIDGSNGYRQELVIKGDRTIPEYGGGLCQVSTTMFRAALQSGLPITARRNHSYRVIYYEPAGIDATIYSPAPDMRFKNDTGNHILIITHVDGSDLYYEIYGTKDGRVVKVPERAEVYNITKPGPTKYVFTDELAPGEKRRVERAINGADASFDYVVTYPDGEKKQETFTSHYVAWPEVWLVGKDPNATSTDAEQYLKDTGQLE